MHTRRLWLDQLAHLAPSIDPDPAGGGGGGGRTFSQDELSRIATREKAQGEAAGRSAVLAELGFSDPAAAKAALDAAEQARQAAQTEQQRATEAANRAKADAERDRQAAARERFEAATYRALVEAKCDKPERMQRMLTVQPGATPEAIKADVEALAVDFPERFPKPETDDERKAREAREAAEAEAARQQQNGQQNGQGGGHNGDPGRGGQGGSNSGGSSGGTFGAAGRAEAARRRPQTTT